MNLIKKCLNNLYSSPCCGRNRPWQADNSVKFLRRRKLSRWTELTTFPSCPDVRNNVQDLFCNTELVISCGKTRLALQTLKCLLSWWNRVNFAQEFLSEHTMGPLGEIRAIQTLSISNSGWCNQLCRMALIPSFPSSSSSSPNYAPLLADFFNKGDTWTRDLLS